MDGGGREITSPVTAIVTIMEAEQRDQYKTEKDLTLPISALAGVFSMEQHGHMI